MFTVRLAKETQADLAQLARVYGAPTSSAFAREVLEVVVSGDFEKIKAFNARLLTRMGEQLHLQLAEVFDDAAKKKAPRTKKRARR